MKRKLAVALLTLACASCAAAGPSFDGQWGYRQECRFGHVANLQLHQKGREISGSWDDGTRVRGEDGLLKGEVRNGRAYLWFCSQSTDDPAHTCPNYGPEEAYLQPAGETLIWYRGSAAYITLHRSGPDKTVPVDESDCAEGDE